MSARLVITRRDADRELQTRTHARTKLSITDLDSSRGTVVNGESIQGKHALKGDEHSIMLGHYPHALRFVTPTRLSRTGR
jgi:pSer/pThr/pTyr-binding forkhead associated (FHA) protein